MYIIKAPTSITEKAWGLDFISGEAKTDNDYLASKLKSKGYRAVKTGKREPSKFDGFTVEDLIVYANENSIDIGNATSANGIIKKIIEAESST